MPLSDKDRRTLRIGGIVAGVLLVGVILMNVLASGGGDDVPEPTGPPVVTPTDEPSPDGPTGPSSPGISPVAVFTGRDPFSIPPGFLVSPSPTGGTTSPGTSPTGGTTSPGTSPTGGTSSPPPTQPGNGASANIGGHTVVLLDVFRVSGVDTVQVEVNGRIYNVSEGETFGPNGAFELRSVSGNCGTFLFGDESFTLCVRPQK